MKKFDTLYSNFIKEEEMTQRHEIDTISHPVKDRMMNMFKNWVKEGEHQDGEAFWDNFNTPNEAAEDFLRTVEDKNPQI